MTRDPQALTVSSPAGAVLLAYLTKQAAVLRDQEPALLRDGPDAVHKSRVATRRMRSALRTYDGVLEESRAAPLAGELRWLGEMLGAPRDAEVLRDYLGDAVAALAPEEVEGPVAQHLLADLGQMHDDAHRRLVEAMGTARYAALRRLLDAVLTAEPAGELADASADRVLPALLGQALDRAAALNARARRRPDKLGRWHDLRKAAKAVRYCSEALGDVFGGPARVLAEKWTAVTEALGVVQDTVVVRGVLGDVAWEAGLRGEPVATYGVLQRVQLERRERALADGVRALDEALAPEVSAWLAVD